MEKTQTLSGEVLAEHLLPFHYPSKTSLVLLNRETPLGSRHLRSCAEERVAGRGAQAGSEPSLGVTLSCSRSAHNDSISVSAGSGLKHISSAGWRVMGAGAGLCRALSQLFIRSGTAEFSLPAPLPPLKIKK